MVVLGLNAFGQNPAAALVVDGKLRAFSHEERFNRLKSSHSLFPSQAASWSLKSQGIDIAEVDKIAINWDCHKYPFTILRNFASIAFKGILGKKPDSGIRSAGDGMGNVIRYITTYRPSNYRSMLYAALRECGCRGPLPEVVYVNHHLCHAYQTYYQSGFDDALVLVADGHGEESCISGYTVRDGKFTRILHYPIPYSLGWFYGGFTAYLGFHANRDEGKLMGLAAYGEAGKDDNPWLKRLDRILKVKRHGFELNPYYFKMGGNYHHARYTDALAKFITDYDADLRPIGLGEKAEVDGKITNRYLLPKYIELAYAAQTRLEEALQALVTNMVGQSGLKKVCLAGGIFMNCKANQVISQMPQIDEVFIHPASSDDGSAIGAAYWVSRQLGADVRDPLRHVQYGAAFGNDEVKQALDICGVEYQALNDPAATTAKLLSQGKILGWFQGGAEMGARALGGRSIIACPTQETIKEQVNSRVKFRENWRPYCPSLPMENRQEYLQSGAHQPFMIRADQATQLLARQAPAIVHIDNSVRPQTVDHEVLPLWHRLICETGKLTDVPVLLNTSFNIRGEPIVNSPFDAIRTFFSTGLDALVMGDFLVLKQGSKRNWQ